jgi:hypothetical protein
MVGKGQSFAWMLNTQEICDVSLFDSTLYLAACRGNHCDDWIFFIVSLIYLPIKVQMNDGN